MTSAVMAYAVHKRLAEMVAAALPQMPATPQRAALVEALQAWLDDHSTPPFRLALEHLPTGDDLPFDALRWMIHNEVEQSTARLDDLDPADAVSELDDVEAVVAWFAREGGDVADITAAMMPEDDAARIRGHAAADTLEPLRRKAIDTLDRSERLNAEYISARDAGLTDLAESINRAVQHAASLADTAQMELLKASGFEPAYTLPQTGDDLLPGAVAALLDQGAANAKQIEAFARKG